MSNRMNGSLRYRAPRRTPPFGLSCRAPIARVLKQARDVGKPVDRDALVFAHCEAVGHREKLPARGHDLRHSYRTVCADIHIDDAMVRILQGWAPRSVSEKYLTRLVLATGQGIRAYQRQVSRKIVELLGSDPTLPGGHRARP